MTAALAVPLTQTQLDTANRLHSRLKQWAAVDNALMALAQAFPAFGPEASLLKVAAVNQLYGTNLYAVVRMAEHVQHVMATTDPKREGPALVERLATLPPASAQERQRHHYSFASKFAHFFVDAEHFPIFDKYARQMLDRHLGRQGRVVDPQHPYQAYVANLGRLRERSGLTWSGRELDRYLWLAGQYRAWRKDAGAKINTELARLFTSPPQAALSDLTLLVPA